jgi:hypothetical protein
MITLFRRIRRKLLSENRVTRYLLYALGEILLVVIGILIALQANNWNEHRKNMELIQQTKKDLISELEDNFQTTNRPMVIGYKLGELLDDFKNNKQAEKMRSFRSSFYNEFGVFDTFTFNLQEENINKWIAFEKDMVDTDESYLWIAKELKKTMKGRKHWESLATELSTTRFKELVDELPWFYDNDSISRQKRWQYINNDPLFRNKVIHYLNFQLNENVYSTALVRAWTLTLLWILESGQDRRSADAMKVWLEDKGLRPYKAFECGNLPYKREELIGFRDVVFIYNATDQPVLIQNIDADGKAGGRKWKVGPYQSYHFVLYKDQFLQVGDDCQRVYAPVRRGYLIVE